MSNALFEEGDAVSYRRSGCNTLVVGCVKKVYPLPEDEKSRDWPKAYHCPFVYRLYIGDPEHLVIGERTLCECRLEKRDDQE